ncbi:MAG: dTMP kinase [Peptoniphilaceae bacterium]|uniref:dTMP kinase n=1 Tax=Parvimonas sp. TaxID=1944660 RepID=UPI0025F18BC7|nr:dTMP kinase [Parvimonas sp.]MCI5997374.1 dTMP kinase [Parvimonas sp.]MDD7765480.1 dTMP kinase [Peptoniphilaceae bacterium]MDY3051021.1 dTMP kinase [Parvimonas sp.]
MKRGIFITFEGPDGCGKTSIMNLLKDYYKENKNIIFTREPGGTIISEKIREIILSNDSKEMSDKTEALLYAASRAQHIDQLIRPNLENGKVVISDRFVLSSLAYQGGGRALGVDNVRNINNFAIGEVKPDMVLFFYVDPLTTLKRKSLSINADRLELSGDDFHNRVYDTYMKLLDEMKDEKYLCRIDATLEMKEVFENVKKVIDEKLEELV